jgi:hypothetical protein
MTTPTPECPACHERMKEGFTIDLGHNGRVGRARWAEGLPEKSFVQGIRTKDRRVLDTVTFRCPRCGWLIWFAPEPTASPDA